MRGVKESSPHPAAHYIRGDPPPLGEGDSEREANSAHYSSRAFEDT